MPTLPQGTDRTTETLVFADETSVEVAPFTLGMHREWQALQTDESPESYDRLAKFLHRCLPHATPEFIDDLTDVRIGLIVAQGMGRLEAAVAMLEGNGRAGAQAASPSTPPPSGPPTSTPTPSPASPAPSPAAAAGTTTPTAPRSGRSSPPSTRSRSASGSTGSTPKGMR